MIDTGMISPYRGLMPYTEADYSYFFGRDQEIATLAANLEVARFTLFYGPSGVGKTSLLRAGVVHNLQQRAQADFVSGGPVEIIPVYFNRWQREPLAGLIQAVEEAMAPYAPAPRADGATSNGTSEITTAAFTSWLADASAKTGADLLIILDQFEEYFLYPDEGGPYNFANALVNAVNTPKLQANFMLSLREDGLARLDFFKGRIPFLLDNRLSVDRLDHAAAREAIEKPLAQYYQDTGQCVTIEPALVDSVIDQLCTTRAGLVRHGTGAAQTDGDRIETPYLQLVMTRLWTEEQRQGSLILRTKTLAALGDTTAIVATYLDDIMEALSEEEQALAARCFDRLVTRSGSKVALTQADIVGYAGGSQQVVEQLLRTLVGQRVLHVVPYTLGESRYEITHDVLGQAILQWQERFQLKEDQRAEAQRLQEEAQSVLAETQRQAAEELAEEQRQAAKRLRRRNRALVSALAIAVVAILAAAILLFIALIQYRAARNAATVAENQQGLAIEAKATADVNAAEAVNAKATARANLNLAQQKLDELKVEELLASGRDQKAQLDVNGAIADFNAAAVAATGMGKVLDVSGEISDTARYVATTYVQEGEKILCEAFFDQPEKCRAPITDASAAPITTSVLVSQTYLAWAHDAAPQVVGWSSYTSTVQQHAVISATALFSQALTLNPPSDTPVYIWIAPGAFAIGSTAEQCEKAGVGECPFDELPGHAVELDGYWIQRTEVTNEQYKRCVEAGACEPPANAYWDKPGSARLPVTDLDWNEASAFAAWVGGRLPTEAEWEKGCRTPDGRVYPWGDEPPATERLNYNYEFGSTTEVGGFPAGANGLYDMAGNVWEWTADWYNEEYYSSSAARNPVGPEEGEYRTLRGGTWTSNGNDVRCAHRIPGDANLRLYDGGFRVVTP